MSVWGMFEIGQFIKASEYEGALRDKVNERR